MTHIKTIFLGDTTEYLATAAMIHDHSAQLLTQDSKDCEKTQTYYTSIGEFSDEKSFLATLLKCNKIYYLPPPDNNWTNASTKDFTEYFLYIILNVSDIEIVGFDQLTTSKTIKDAHFEKNRIFGNLNQSAKSYEHNIFVPDFKNPFIIENSEFSKILDKMYDIYHENDDYSTISSDICFLITENCESQKQWDWDFLLLNVYHCLKDIAIFINDDYYYNIFKRNKFNVWKYWPSEDISSIFNINSDFDLRLNKIDKTFCRLSNSRHDHNYYIHKFLVQKQLLEITNWSYNNNFDSQYYYNFNRFLNLRESKYETLPQKTYPGDSFSINMSLTSLQPHIKSAITINCETVFHGHGPYYSEKLIKCVNLARPFIEVSSPHTLKDLRRWGFESFPDLIDESYDDIEDPHKRIEHVCNEIDRLSKIPLQHFKDYIKKNEEKLHHNFLVGQKMAQSAAEADWHGLTLS